MSAASAPEAIAADLSLQDEERLPHSLLCSIVPVDVSTVPEVSMLPVSAVSGRHMKNSTQQSSQMRRLHVVRRDAGKAESVDKVGGAACEEGG